MKNLFLSLGCIAMSLSAGAVTFNVEVPEGTRAVYVAGQFNNWDAAGALRLEKKSTNLWGGTFDEIPDSEIAGGYKYLCGPDWTYVEKSSTGAETGNRTVLGNPDKVGSWYHSYNPSLKEFSVNVNNYQRKVRVWVPESDMSSDRTYPVIFYTGVQQRYENAGSDDRGDDFFGSQSWDAGTVAESLGTECILVEMYSFVGENIPFASKNFIGSGATDSFLDDYISKVVEYVRSNYAADPRPEATTIMGADLGGLQAIYTTLKFPDTFGKCIAVSPLLWINREEILQLGASAQSKFLFAYGSSEKNLIADDVNALMNVLGENAKSSVIEGGVHNDDSWTSVLPTAFNFATSSETELPVSIALKRRVVNASLAANDFDLESMDWKLYSGLDTETLTLDGTTFTLYDSYMSKGGTAKKVKTLVSVVPASFKKTYYWNIGVDNGNGVEYLLDANKKTTFSSKKTVDSWIRIVLNEDGSVESNSAAKTGFTVVQGTGTKIIMTPGQASFKQRATVEFTGTDKTFAINYGSVNSLSDMGALTGTYSVSDNCIEANITFDYLTNEVSIVETKWGDSIDDVKIERMTIEPAVTTKGEPVKLTVRIDETKHCTPIAMLSSNYGQPSEIALTDNDGEWTAILTNLPEGIHRVSLSLRRGDNEKNDIADVAVRINAGAKKPQQQLTVNAYEHIDWATTGRYKANFHTHTSQSFDTKFKPNEVVDLYHGAGYQILALTDHDANPYPWDHFDLFDSTAESRNADELGMLSIPGVELSKDNRNTWDEATGGNFNHHNDFFTGRKGQEFASLRESYAYTNAIGGLQIINHPGQYWSLSKSYSPGEKNSPEWHAENFRLYESLIGLEVYNQGNRRPDDRILWDQILSIVMPQRPVWGYSCDDTHTREQYFRNYEYMLMPDLNEDDLKHAMREGNLYFSYEYTGSGEAKAPHVESLAIDHTNHIITVNSNDADNIQWIYSTDKEESAATSKRRSTIVAVGPTFNYTGFEGTYVRPLLTNAYGETCLQPFGFSVNTPTGKTDDIMSVGLLTVYPNPASDILNVKSTAGINAVTVFDTTGKILMRREYKGAENISLDVSALPRGMVIVMAATPDIAETYKIILE